MSELIFASKAYDDYQNESSITDPFFIKDSHGLAFRLGAKWLAARILEKAREKGVCDVCTGRKDVDHGFCGGHSYIYEDELKATIEELTK